jgi:hypothetical protein
MNKIFHMVRALNKVTVKLEMSIFKKVVFEETSDISICVLLFTCLIIYCQLLRLRGVEQDNN